MNLQLTLACWGYDRTRPILDGRVKSKRYGKLFLEALPECGVGTAGEQGSRGAGER